jgi:hypothetical protein
MSKALERLMDLLGRDGSTFDGHDRRQGRKPGMYGFPLRLQGSLRGVGWRSSHSAQREGERDARTGQTTREAPFLVGFGIDWFRFTICTTHTLYGEDDPAEPRRLKEIRLLATFLADRTRE